MSVLAKKLLEAAHKSDGFKAWALAPIAAEYIQELEAQRDELLEALQFAVEAIESEHPDVLCGAALQARAAIAKAKGSD